jgi:DNA polymerase III subunit chi
MTLVDFYVLPETTSEARWLFACRLIDKVHKLGHRVLVALDNEVQAKAFDDLLWTFKPESFIPHQLISSMDAESPREIAVEITYTKDSGHHHGLLVNLSSEIPSYFSRFERLSEIVIQESQALTTSRERFSFYKGRGYPIETRKI